MMNQSQNQNEIMDTGPPNKKPKMGMGMGMGIVGMGMGMGLSNVNMNGGGSLINNSNSSLLSNGVGGLSTQMSESTG